MAPFFHLLKIPSDCSKSAIEKHRLSQRCHDNSRGIAATIDDVAHFFYI
jgi:hypothetical protein